MNVIRLIAFSFAFLLLHPIYTLADDGRHWDGHADHGSHGDDHGRHDEHGDRGEHHEHYHSGFSYNFTYWPDSYNYYTGPYAPPTVVETPTIINPPVVVESPIDVTTPVPVNTDVNEFTVNIPNDSGGYTAVVIRRSGSGFIGPQGEYYPQFPSVAQLRLMYARK